MMLKRGVEQEKFFKCPFCLQKISMLLDLSVDGMQTYVEDCEVCCRAISLVYEVQNGELVSFTKGRAYD
ncbi:MAG: CPXCG motif-containing cysteine-rich protein [Bdellovibrionales bacterium]